MTKRAGSAPQAASLDREGRLAANAELRSARNELDFVRSLLWVNVAVNALIGVGFLIAELHFLGGICLAVALVFFIGVRTLHRYPFGWTLALAALQTLGLVPALLDGQRPYVSIVVCALLWLAVPVTARAARLLRDHGDVLDAKLMRSRYVADAPKAEARANAEQRRRVARKAEWKRFGTLGGMVALIAVLGFFTLREMGRPRALEPRLEALRVALAQGDATTAESLCSEGMRGLQWRKVRTILEREGWLPSGVELGPPEFIRRSARGAEVHFPLPRGTLKTRWHITGRDWTADRFVFSGVRSTGQPAAVGDDE